MTSCADVKLVPMAPDDQCLYRSVIAALQDISKTSEQPHTSVVVDGAPTLLLLLDLPADPPAGLPYDLRPSGVRHRDRSSSVAPCAGQLSPRRDADERQELYFFDRALGRSPQGSPRLSRLN